MDVGYNPLNGPAPFSDLEPFKVEKKPKWEVEFDESMEQEWEQRWKGNLDYILQKKTQEQIEQEIQELRGPGLIPYQLTDPNTIFA